ncbi:hypothetical protein EF847_01470 [Actinobacteria bacterium YIM 96077]|uniref:YprB ribonuclease H-like domain-containing protein n=1 Tax=Phytoactinopolyspora halophila TaxID=1981511 RepID=A0A329QFY4_9ACTN|nr:ribonuclease H-like domain-containing protein [Phytoactinopolyspora halophila]AYY11590.1 hypothetical protein EF847_01470 [Actinobacteria bacterium YIM 96077]RAW11136.1 hypothetical protein DPM12_17495 [Phytoactinopolyspora halophila]
MYLDIETSPHLAHVWGLWQQNISLAQLQQATEMLSFAAKWRGEKKIHFYSGGYNPDGVGNEQMVEAAHSLLDQADVVVHFNGKKFDVPHLNREFKAAGLAPPAPYKQLDILETVRRRFKLASNKLAYVAHWLGLENKAPHEGHELWVKCLAGDQKAWRTMRTYNKRDVTLLEEVHNELKPWLVNSPNVALHDGLEGDHCRECGSGNLRREGYAFTKQGKFQQYQCRVCGSWSRGGKAINRVDLREVAA